MDGWALTSAFALSREMAIDLPGFMYSSVLFLRILHVLSHVLSLHYRCCKEAVV